MEAAEIFVEARESHGSGEFSAGVGDAAQNRAKAAKIAARFGRPDVMVSFLMTRSQLE